MTKLLFILLVGLFFEAAGVTFLKKGLIQIGEAKGFTVPEVVRVVKAGAANPMIWLGVLLEALFFACLLVLLSKGDVSFVWPLTALSFVMTTFAALMFLKETVSPARWAGVIFIMIGAGLISYSEHTKEKAVAPQVPAIENR